MPRAPPRSCIATLRSASNQLLPHQAAALQATADALCRQQADFVYTDLPPELAETIVTAAAAVSGISSPWSGYFDSDGRWVG